jgi:hypothetical protein
MKPLPTIAATALAILGTTALLHSEPARSQGSKATAREIIAAIQREILEILLNRRYCMYKQCWFAIIFQPLCE